MDDNTFDKRQEFKNLQELKDYLSEVPKDILDKELWNDGNGGHLTLFYGYGDRECIYYN